MKRTWIKNAQIVNEGQTFQGSVVIEDEIIVEILQENETPSTECDETIDASGCYLIPGVIDDHVHFRDPGLTHKADIHTESMAAAAGGVTSYMDMPNTNPQTTTLEALEDKFKNAATKSIVNYSFYSVPPTEMLTFSPNSTRIVCAVSSCSWAQVQATCWLTSKKP